MNILVLNYEFPPLGGGGGAFSFDLASELAKKHRVDVLTSRFRGLATKEKINGMTVYRVPVVGRTSLYSATMISMLSFVISGTLAGIRLMSKKKYDLIHTHFAVPTGPVGYVLSRIFNKPNILSIHGSDIYNPARKMSPHRYGIFRWTVRLVMNSANRIVAQSGHIKHYAEKFYSPKKDIDIIPLGMPSPDFSLATRETLSMQKDIFYIVSIGRMAKVKGYDVLIRTMALLKEKGRNAHLILIGDGPERASLEKLSAALGLSDRISFPGWLSGPKKFQFLSACDLYVMSSLHEGFGVVLLEAMFCGLPIVATNKGGQTDIITDGKNGILVSPGDAKVLDDAISDMMSSPDKRKSMSLANRENVKRYNISSVAERYMNAFTETAKSCR
jgi:glycosyltransferase involved in cell wall biosynthesis